jgi:hypothetical protein
MIRLPRRLFSFFRSADENLPIVGGMATMPSRAHTFPTSFRSVIDQVDRLYLYLDGHEAVPEAAKDDPRVIPIFSRDVPGLHGNGKFLGLTMETGRCLYLGIDDDIAYPSTYARRMSKALAAYRGSAVVGYHGSLLLEPFTSYAKSRETIWFAGALPKARPVDVLGTGTVMFDTGMLRFDMRTWPQVNMADLYFALEAARANLALICLPRQSRYLRALEEQQSDSIYARLLRDDSVETALAIELREQLAKSCPARQN